jgi:lipopolysaccharide/colanic/teichoic acid biosynthesis glycosyltransferase
MDRVLAVVLMVLTSPLVLLAVVLVKLTSRGPAFYRQTRLGLNGRPFPLYKIRTMYDNCESYSGPRWSTPGDTRVIPVGHFLRTSHLDELPQLWNLLRGDMSLVGPRPERPEFAPHLERVLPHYRDRLLVRPGLSGLAQVQLPPDTDLSSVRRKLACDLYYVQHLSLWLDLRIMAATVAYLARVPVDWSRRLLGVPGGEPVEHAYRQLAAAHDGTLEPQPA